MSLSSIPELMHSQCEVKPMATQPVQLTIMDSARPPRPAVLEVEGLGLGRRTWRAVGRGALVSGIGGLVVILPILHLCGAALLLLGGPILAAVTFRVSVLTVGEQQVPCPKCDAVVPVEAKSGGWPVRLHCGSCGSTFSARP
jgi:ribosomal protein S27AE